MDTIHPQHAPVLTPAGGNCCAPSQWAERVCGPDLIGTCCCRASSDDHIIFQMLTGTGTSSGTSPTSTLPQAPTADTGISEALEALAAKPNAQANCGVGSGCSASTVGLPLNMRRLRCNPRDFAILGISSLKTGVVPASVTVSRYRSKTGIFAVILKTCHRQHYVRIEEQTGFGPKPLMC